MYQFMHLDAYSRVGNTQKRGGKTSSVRSARDIACEAERVVGYCSHVSSPQPPTIVFGCSPSHAVDLAESWSETAKDAQGRKLRRDGMILAAGTISAPREAVENGDLNWQKFRDDCIQWLQKTYGNRLVSVVQHMDESNPHIHFYAVPQVGENFDLLHPGLKARNEIRRDKTAPAEAAGIAFRNAMSEFQNDFFTNVAVKHGMVRLGPRRQRLTNSEYKKNLIAAKEIAKTYQLLERQPDLEAKTQALEAQAVLAEKTAQNAAKQRQQAENDIKRLNREKQNLQAEIAASTAMKMLLPIVKTTAAAVAATSTTAAAIKLKLQKEEIEKAAEERGRKQQLLHDQQRFEQQNKTIKKLKSENELDRQHFQNVVIEKNALLEKAKQAEKVPKLEQENTALKADNTALKAENQTLWQRLNGNSGPKGPLG